MNYTLEVKGPSPADVLVQSFILALTENLVGAGNLSENAVYSFRVLVSNIVGSVSSDRKIFCESFILLVSSMFVCYYRHY